MHFFMSAPQCAFLMWLQIYSIDEFHGYPLAQWKHYLIIKLQSYIKNECYSRHASVLKIQMREKILTEQSVCGYVWMGKLAKHMHLLFPFQLAQLFSHFLEHKNLQNEFCVLQGEKSLKRTFWCRCLVCVWFHLISSVTCYLWK